MSASRTAIVLIGSLVCALLSGAVIGAIGAYAYLIVISPAMAAITAGMATRSLVGVARLTRARAAGIIGGLAGAVTVITILLVVFQMERASITRELTATQGVSDTTLNTYRERMLSELTGDAGSAMRPLMLRIHSGATLFGETGLDLGPGFNVILLLVELGVAVYIGARLGWERASEPFCAYCDTWYARRMLGSATLGSRSSVQADLQNRQFHRLGRKLSVARIDTREPVQLHSWLCDTCDQGEVRLELEVTEAGKRARIVKAVQAPHSALDDILESQAFAQS